MLACPEYKHLMPIIASMGNSIAEHSDRSDGSGEIVPEHVFLDHAPGGEFGKHGRHGSPDSGDPFAGNAAFIAIVETGNHFFAQDSEEIDVVQPILFDDG